MMRLIAKASREPKKDLQVALYIDGKPGVSYGVSSWMTTISALMHVLENEFDLLVTLEATAREARLKLQGVDGEKIAAKDESPEFYQAWINGWLVGHAAVEKDGA